MKICEVTIQNMMPYVPVLLYFVAGSLSLTSLTSSGDLAPLGSISKNDAKLFQKFVHVNLRESMSRTNLA